MVLSCLYPLFLNESSSVFDLRHSPLIIVCQSLVLNLSVSFVGRYCIPVDDYCLKPIYEDKYSKYIGASVIASDVDGIQEVGPNQKVLKEYCSICGGSVDFKAICKLTSKYPRRRLQWFCKIHGRTHGPTTPRNLKWSSLVTCYFMEIIELLLRKKISNDVTEFILIINGNLLYK